MLKFVKLFRTGVRWRATYNFSTVHFGNLRNCRIGQITGDLKQLLVFCVSRIADFPLIWAYGKFYEKFGSHQQVRHVS